MLGGYYLEPFAFNTTTFIDANAIHPDDKEIEVEVPPLRVSPALAEGVSSMAVAKAMNITGFGHVPLVPTGRFSSAFFSMSKLNSWPMQVQSTTETKTSHASISEVWDARTLVFEGC